MEKLEKKMSLDLFTPTPAETEYSTQGLFGEARGKMFGVLEGVRQNGNSIKLYAFSGQYNGHWSLPGWAPPLFEEKLWLKVNNDTEKQIKQLTKHLADSCESPEEYRQLKDKRRKMSQQLTARLHSLYTIYNFKGQAAGLTSFFPDNRGIPTGTGDCCAPKLLNHALQQQIIPIGISEFYWGRSNRSKTRHHGHFYPACTDKCQPLMGFLLCGLQETLEGRAIPS